MRKVTKKDVHEGINRIQGLYHKGSRKLERELDVVNLVKAIRKLRLMA